MATSQRRPCRGSAGPSRAGAALSPGAAAGVGFRTDEHKGKGFPQGEEQGDAAGGERCPARGAGAGGLPCGPRSLLTSAQRDVLSLWVFIFVLDIKNLRQCSSTLITGCPYFALTAFGCDLSKTAIKPGKVGCAKAFASVPVRTGASCFLRRKTAAAPAVNEIIVILILIFLIEVCHF